MAGNLALMQEVINANRTGGQMSPEAAGMMATDMHRGLAAQSGVDDRTVQQRNLVKQQMQNDFVQGKMTLNDIVKTGVMTDGEIASLANLINSMRR